MSARTYTLRDLAEVLGVDPSSTKRRASRERWPYQEEAVRGGRRRRYAETALPADVRQALLRQAVTQAAQALPVPECPTLPTPGEERVRLAQMTDTQRAVLEARLTVLALIDEMAGGGSRGEAVSAFLAMARAGELPSAAAEALRRANAKSTSGRLADRASIYRWFAAKKGGTSAIAPRSYRPRPMPAWLPKLLSIYQQPQKPSVSACVAQWPAIYPDITPPQLRAAQQRIQSLPAEVRNFGRLGRAARRAIQPFVRRTMDGLWPMDVVTVDGHMFKAYVRHPLTGRKMRPELTTYLDIATRRAVGFSAWLAESQHAIWIALGDMVLAADCGVPALHYSDNGAYRGERHRAVMARIGSTLMYSEAYRAQARGVIERFNSSVWIPLARTHETYVGDDADAEFVKKQLAVANGDGANLMGWEDFLPQCRQALATYNDRPHESLKRLTPMDSWRAAQAEGWQPTPLAEDDLHDLMPSEERIVRRGEISLPWGRYFSEELRAWHGLTVRASFNPMDGARIWVADDRGRYICSALRDGNARPYVSSTQIEHARAQREQGRIARLERKLAAVREEGAAHIEYQPTAIDPQVQAEVLAALAEEPREVACITDERRLHAYWMRIEQRCDAGEPVGDDERAELAIYRASGLYRSMTEFFDSFGLRAEDFA
jgi:putative transposase